MRKIACLMSALVMFLFSACTFRNDDAASSASQPSQPSEGETLAFGQSVAVGDVMSLTFTSAEWGDEVRPSDTRGDYAYMSDRDREKYLIVRGNIRNATDSQLDVKQVISGEITVGDDSLPASFALENSTGTAFGGRALPLQTLGFVAYASFPDGACEAFSSGELKLDVTNEAAEIGSGSVKSSPHSTYRLEIGADHVK